MKNGKEKRRKITLKRGENALKMPPLPSQTYLSGEKIESQKRGGGGNDIYYISLKNVESKDNWASVL